MDQEQAYEMNFIFRLACDFISCIGYCAAEIKKKNFFFNKNDKKISILRNL